MNIKPVYTDGTLYTIVAVCAFLEMTFGSDAAYKYVPPDLLFWLKAIIGSIGAGAGALVTFRSKTYANHVATTADTTIDTPLIKPILPPLPPTQQPQNLNTKV